MVLQAPTFFCVGDNPLLPFAIGWLINDFLPSKPISNVLTGFVEDQKNT